MGRFQAFSLDILGASTDRDSKVAELKLKFKFSR